MKRIMTLLLIIAFASTLTYSQSAYKAREGVSSTSTAAKKVASDAKLMIVATMSGQVQGITLTFDESKGTCTAWIYSFRSVSKDTTLYFLATKLPIIGMTAIGIPLDASALNLPFKPDSSLDGKTWIDSDAMIQAVHNTQKYIDFKAKNTDAALKMTGLAVQPSNGESLWGVTISATAGNLNCMINAETSTATCFDFSSVDDLTSLKLAVTPNPVSETAVLTVPTGYNFTNATAAIFDSQGRIVKALGTLDLNSTGQTAFQVDNLIAGVYYLMFSNGTQTDGCKFVVVK
jgi:hypothetical protein